MLLSCRVRRRSIVISCIVINYIIVISSSNNINWGRLWPSQVNLSIYTTRVAGEIKPPPAIDRCLFSPETNVSTTTGGRHLSLSLIPRCDDVLAVRDSGGNGGGNGGSGEMEPLVESRSKYEPGSCMPSACVTGQKFSCVDAEHSLERLSRDNASFCMPLFLW